MTEDIINISQGEDIDCEYTLKQKNGSILDMSSVGVRVYAIITDGYGTIKSKYKLGLPSTGWIVMTSALLATGKIKFSILSNVTTFLEPGRYYIEIKARFPSANHSDDFFFDIEEKEYAFSIKKSQINTLTLPA